MQPYKLAEDHTGTIHETVTSVLEGKHPSKTILSCATLEIYKETPIFIPVEITEEAVESVAQKRYQKQPWRVRMTRCATESGRESKGFKLFGTKTCLHRNRVFLIVDAKNAFNKINRAGML